MENKKSFGEYVFKKRKENGLTQKEFAEKLFITESAVSKWERGLSYPDITLIKDICHILNISEHELLTASEDVEARNADKLVKRYLRLVNGYKIILMFIYVISLVTCLICNITIDQKLSWFFIVLASILVAISLTLVPVMIKDKRGIATLSAFVVTLGILLLTICIYTEGNWFFVSYISTLFGLSLIFLPFLLNNIWLPENLRNNKSLIYFIVESIFLYIVLIVINLFTGGGWVLRIALPITSFSLLLPWGMMLIIRYAKINGYYKAAGCFALASASQFSIQRIINNLLDIEPQSFGFRYNLSIWNGETINENVNMIVFFTLLGIAVVFTIAGVFTSIQSSTNK